MQSQNQAFTVLSDPFYTSSSGYKMRLRLSSFHENNAQATHISLFFILMRGEYDSILKWPFEYKVSFCIHDQIGAEQHILHTIDPQTQLNHFQRPQSEMSIAGTITKFCPLEALKGDNNRYVQDDTMFIRVIVDFYGAADNLVSFTFNLNPGLPSEERLAQIEDEIKRSCSH